MTSPSAFAERLLALIVRDTDWRDAVIGDLREEHARLCARVGATRGLEAELALGRRVVDIMDATLTRVLRLQPSRFAEWQQVKRVTVRGTVSRGAVGSDDGLPTLAQASPTEVVGSPTAETKAA